MSNRKTAMKRGEVDLHQEAKCIIARHGVTHVQSSSLEYLSTDLVNRTDVTHEERMKIVYIAKDMVADAGTFEDWADRKERETTKAASGTTRILRGNIMQLRQLCTALGKCPPWVFPKGLAIWIKPEGYQRIAPDNMDWMDAECMLTWTDMEMGDEWIIWHEITTKEAFEEIVFILPQRVIPTGAQRCYEIVVNRHHSKEQKDA